MSGVNYVRRALGADKPVVITFIYTDDTRNKLITGDPN